VSMCMCACTCLCCVKMNLVISTSKMTNYHDGLLSRWYWRREKKSCSCSSLFFHKQLPINVTFHLSMLVLSRQTIFNDVVLMTRWYFDLSPCPWYFFLIYRSIYVILSHRNLISRFCHPMGQMSSVSILFQTRMKEEKIKENYILSYRRFIFLYHITNHCLVSSSSRNNYCSMLFYLFVSDWPMVNYCKCEQER
jgi:hypothetical protein